VKHPPGPPMTLGDMRHLGVQRGRKREKPPHSEKSPSEIQSQASDY